MTSMPSYVAICARLGIILKKATGHLNLVENQLNLAVHDSRSSAAESIELTRGLDSQISALGEIAQSEPDPANLKQSIEARVQAIRSSLTDYVETYRRNQTVYETRILDLTTQLQGFQRESDQLRQTLAAEQEKAYRDPLTQLPNRLAYNERARVELLRARRNHSPLTLAVLDLDRFKQINDTYGHQVGDKVLRHSAALCQRRVRATDLIARFGGEEFVVLFPETPLDRAAEVCEELRGQLGQAAFQYQGQRVPVTISVGVSGLVESDTLESLFERADRALYQAKNGGRNKVSVADPGSS
ncbi:MAG: GGDEF domain-containing protein [Gammaproteobacteria bacterium]|nr:GGDEF domain-containing protein [Gammaproteobacteria bacterium]